MGSSFALKRIKDVLWVLAAAGLVVGIGRFVFGLGASTNMLDTLPWGLWKIFNMVAGAALATSGFVVACIIYILRLEKYRSVARLSVLIGFLGYGASLTALIFDIGLPHRGWHPLLIWNPHSFLFEVFWCVSCYWSITALELVPIVTERFPLKKFTHWWHETLLPFVVLGITLSTMHHSSLGSLFLTSPTRLHPLWFTTWIPPEFFISAMGAGLSVIVLISLMVCGLYGRKPNLDVLGRLAKGSLLFLGLFLVLRVIDLSVHHKWNFVFGPDFTWESTLFLVEFGLQAILPVLLLAIPAVRRSVTGLAVATGSAAIGLIMHRIDTGIVGYFRSAGQTYVPNLSEFVLSFGVLAAAGLLFFFLIERFYVLDEPADEHGHGPKDGPKLKLWTRKEALSLITSPDAVRWAFLFVLVIPISVLAFSDQATGPFRPIAQTASASTALDPMRTVLRIDGNGTAEFANFPHLAHQKHYGDDASCIKCHHLNLPGDHNTACYRCHRDMEVATELFDHIAHQERHGGEGSCAECHDPEHPGRENAKACIACHEDNMVGLKAHTLEGFDHRAIGYKQAMHGVCITCHRLNEKDPAKADSLGNCQFCHPLNQDRKAGFVQEKFKK